MTATLAPAVRVTVDNHPGWRVTTVESRRGCARATLRGSRIEVLVGEPAGRADNGVGSCSAFVLVSCAPTGSASVTAREAPPAIVVTPAGPRVTPADAGVTSLERLAPGERLLVLSSASFDEMPELLADLLCTTPDRLLVSDPAELLAALFGATGQGAGALIERLTDPNPGRTR